MMTEKEFINDSSRRKFIKGLGATALLPLVPGFAWSGEPAGNSKKHRVLCCNIRVALDEDETKGVGWSQRRKFCMDLIKDQDADIICLQEVLKVQAEDFRKEFSKFSLLNFDGPEMDAHATGYHGIAKNPILFSNERYELLAASSYWLSETPLVAGSKSWDTARARNANWVRLREKKTGRELRVVNLHLDHVSGPAKINGARMVAEESVQYPPDFPQILAGDFNTRHDSRVFDSVKAAGWLDSYKAVHGDADPGFTGHAFQGVNYPNGKPFGKIDFILTKGAVKAVNAGIIKDHKNGQYPSDHFFVSADVEIG